MTSRPLCELTRQSRRTFLKSGAALATTATFGALAAPALAKSGPIEIKVGSTQPEGQYLVQDVMLPWCKEVERRTDNAVTFTWYHGSSLVKTPQTVKALRTGLVEMANTMATWMYEDEFPINSVLHLPLNFTTILQKNRTYRDAFREIPEFTAEFDGLHMFGFHASDFMNLDWAAGLPAARTLADFKGRTGWAVNKSIVMLEEAIGMVPMTLKQEDLYMALQRKSMDGLVFNTAALPPFKFDEVTNAHNIVNWPGGTIPAGLNQKVWSGLPSDVQGVIDDLSDDWTDLCGAIVDNRREATLKGLRERGDEIVEMDDDMRAAMASAGQPLVDAWMARLEQKGINGTPILDKVNALLAKHADATMTTVPDWVPEDWLLPV
ncbi:TRAP transporter substrate-binding protein [Frigidibacter sp. MR17.24]|uniref:TRAP transporter substrate-binding protein n=1 Tax=Frigidibacter sp. MR17.24 TaxID=3127345 RepID=UPI0030130706